MMLAAEGGSFRDPAGRVYRVHSDTGVRILRGVDSNALENYRSLVKQPFYKALLSDKKVVESKELSSTDPAFESVVSDGWEGVLEHQLIPFISYPYEWTFSMLKEAALLQLEVIEQSLEGGWTLKDATPYNVQWVKNRPIFIDVASFEPWVEGEPWVGYRQFCSMFLTPLLIRTHLEIDHIPLLRSYLDGIPAMEAVKFFHGFKKYKRGVLSHIVLPSKVEGRIFARERDREPSKTRKQINHRKAMVIGLVQSLSRLVSKLSIPIEHTDWSQYDKTHSYEDEDFKAKQAFVSKHAAAKSRDHIWDIGCNTGTFSKLASKHCNQVISLDGDHDAIVQLHQALSEEGVENILPIVMNLSNVSPNQGWAGVERKAFDKRKTPDLVMCLALIHHTRISTNIPNKMFLYWLHSLNADVIIEFVDRHDEMVIKLLTNKKEQYLDYNLDNFVAECEALFTIVERSPLKGGAREIFYLSPKQT